VNPATPLTEKPTLSRGPARPSQGPVDGVPWVRRRTPQLSPLPTRARHERRWRLRARHARESGRRHPQVSLCLVSAVEEPQDDLVLHILRARGVTDLDAAQVAALAELPPSVTVRCLDRLVRLGLARRHLVGGRERFGLL
jgi:hypothetical protein